MEEHEAVNAVRVPTGSRACSSSTPIRRFVSICSTWLSLEGYEVLEAANGQEALDLAFTSLPAVVLLDLSLPVLDGFGLADALRADERTRELPLVVLTGETGPHVTGASSTWVRPASSRSLSIPAPSPHSSGASSGSSSAGPGPPAVRLRPSRTAAAARLSARSRPSAPARRRSRPARRRGRGSPRSRSGAPGERRRSSRQRSSRNSFDGAAPSPATRMMFRIAVMSSPPASSTGWMFDGREDSAVRAEHRAEEARVRPWTAPMMFVATSPPGASRERASSRNSRVARWNGIESE